MTDLSTSGLSSETVKKIINVFSQHPQIQEVMLYGSRAKGNYHNGSDIDLCITRLSSDSLSLEDLEVELDDLLLPYDIDLSLLGNIQNTQLIEHIQRVAVMFYSKDRE